MGTDYVPKQKDAKATWAHTWEANMATVKAALNLTDEEDTAVKGNCAKVYNSVAQSNAAENTFKQAMSATTTNMNNGIKSLRGYARQFKANPNYTEELGKLIGIVGSDSDFDPDTYKSTMEAMVFPGHVTLKFTKKGVEGVNVYSRLAGEIKWTKLSFDSHSPYVDNRPLAVDGVAETREYMCMGILHDQEIGQPSNILSVLFGG